MSDIFSNVFDKLCTKSQLKDSEIARRLKVDRSTIGRWRSGERSPALSKIPEIARLFNVHPLVFVEENSGGIPLPIEEKTKDTNRTADVIAAHLDGKELDDELLEEALNYIDYIFEKKFSK